METQSIYTNGFQIPHLKKKKKNRVLSGFARVPGQPAGLPGFGRAVATAGLLLNPDWSSHRVDPPGRAGFNNCARDYYHRRQIVKNNKAKILKKGKKKSISFRKGKKNQVNPDKSLKPDLIFKTQPVKSLNHIQSRNFLISNHFNFEG